MILEDQICSFTLAKRLKEFGISQESLFYYTDKGIAIRIASELIVLVDKPGNEGWALEENSNISAFTVAELGKALPGSINGIQLIMENHQEIKYVSYPPIKTTFGRSEAQARSNMLIWLIENKYVSPREVNKRMAEV